MPVLALELGTLFVGFGLGRLISQSFLGAKAEFVGFGSRLLVSNGFLCAKAERFGRLCNQVLPKKQLSSLQRLKTSGFAKETAFLSAKAQNSRIRLSPNSGTVCRIFYGGILQGFVK